MLEVMSYGEE